MKSHPIDPTALVAGLVFTLIGAGRLLGGLGSIAVQLQFVVPLALIGIGGAILFGDRPRAESDPDDRPGALDA